MAIGASQGAFQIIPLHGFNPTTRDYKFRKAHKKTKTGCLACRAKRVKCDESRPICIRCKSNGRLCAYNQDDNAMKELNQWALTSTQSRAIGPSIFNTSATFLSSPNQRNGTSAICLLHHAHHYWDEIFHFHNDNAKDMLTSDPLVRSTIFAITACHLRHVSANALQHRIAEHFQQSMVLKHFQTTLETPSRELNQKRAAGVMLSATLLIILSFALLTNDATNPLDSWVFSSDEDRLGWLTLQTGLYPVFKHVEMYLPYTIPTVEPIFVGVSQESWATTPLDHNLFNVPQTWIEVFELNRPGSLSDCDVQCDADVYRLPLLVLARLRRVQTTPGNIFKGLLFLGKVQRDFRALLFKRDERALWIMGYWLGYMSCFKDIWWCGRRAIRDYTAVVMYLKSQKLPMRPGIEGERWKSLMLELDLAGIPTNFGT